MARGAAAVLDIVGGVCVSDHEEPTSERLTFIVGDHPVPGEASLRAGTAVLDFARSVPTSTTMLALISGGGSSLCETPREGVPLEYLSEVTRRLLAIGASIEELNMVRAHLSAVKGGGVSRAAGRAIDTYVISDVAGADPGVVASGPTILSFALVDSPWGLVGLFLAYGIYFGLTEPVERAWVADLVPANLRGSAFGFYNGAVGLSALPASLLFGFLWQEFGPPAAFATGAALAAVAAGVLGLVRGKGD